MSQVNSNRTTSADVVLVSFLLTLNGFHSLPYLRVFIVDFQHVIAGLVCLVCETRNLLTLQYTAHSKIPFGRNSYHTETSHLKCIANQLNSFNRHSNFNPTRAGLFEINR